MQVLKAFPDRTVLIYDRGRFDDFRVSFYWDTTYLYSPTDVYLFSILLMLRNNQQVWESIIELSKQINKESEFMKINTPRLMGSLEEDKIFSVLAAAMLAEEKKHSTKLGKRVKLLGCYQVLIEDLSPIEAANWSRGKNWHTIACEHQKHGF